MQDDVTDKQSLELSLSQKKTYLKMLESGETFLRFFKVDGTVRECYATLNKEVLKENGFLISSDIVLTEEEIDSGNVKIWLTREKVWRTINLNRVFTASNPNFWVDLKHG